MPALVASRCDPHLRGFYQGLVGLGKAKPQALMAVERKMLHTIYSILSWRCEYDGRRLFPNLVLSTAAA